MQGVKSKEFGCFWKSLFLASMCYPEKINENNEEHIKKRRHLKNYIHSLQYILPCKYCRIFTKDVLIKTLPLDMSGRKQVMYSLYLWKDAINLKLLAKGCKTTKSSPPFKEILDKYEKMRAKCDKKIGKCV